MLIFIIGGMTTLLSFCYSTNSQLKPSLVITALIIGAAMGKLLELTYQIFKKINFRFSNCEIKEKLLQSKNKISQAEEILRAQVIRSENLKQIVHHNWVEIRQLQRHLINMRQDRNLVTQIKLKEWNHELLTTEIENIQKDNILLERIISNPEFSEYYSQIKFSFLIAGIISIALYLTRKLNIFLTLLEYKFLTWLYKNQKRKTWMIQTRQ